MPQPPQSSRFTSSALVLPICHSGVPCSLVASDSCTQTDSLNFESAAPRRRSHTLYTPTGASKLASKKSFGEASGASVDAQPRSALVIFIPPAPVVDDCRDQLPAIEVT